MSEATATVTTTTSSSSSFSTTTAQQKEKDNQKRKHLSSNTISRHERHEHRHHSKSQKEHRHHRHHHHDNELEQSREHKHSRKHESKSKRREGSEAGKEVKNSSSSSSSETESESETVKNNSNTTTTTAAATTPTSTVPTGTVVVSVVSTKEKEDEERKKKVKEEEQAALDVEMQKRRERVEAWRKERQKQQQQQQQQQEQEQEENKKEQQQKNKEWTLDEDDLDDGEEEKGKEKEQQKKEGDDVDELDRYMETMQQQAALDVSQTQRLIDQMERRSAIQLKQKKQQQQQQQQQQEEEEEVSTSSTQQLQTTSKLKGEDKLVFWNDEVAGGSDSDNEDGKKKKSKQKRNIEHEEDDTLATAGGGIFDEFTEGGKKKKKSLHLLDIDHSKIDYAPFKKMFYVEVPEIARLSREELVRIRREELDGCVIHGKGCPNPIQTWGQCGLSTKIMEMITKVLRFERPTPIQRQAIPAVMSGRDVIACAKTGSGKCLAPNTPVLLGNGSTTRADLIQIGDILIGDDGSPRIVISTTSGFGPLYRVTNKQQQQQQEQEEESNNKSNNYNNGFVCNSNHLLVFEPIAPFIKKETESSFNVIKFIPTKLLSPVQMIYENFKTEEEATIRCKQLRNEFNLSHPSFTIPCSELYSAEANKQAYQAFRRPVKHFPFEFDLQPLINHAFNDIELKDFDICRFFGLVIASDSNQNFENDNNYNDSIVSKFLFDFTSRFLQGNKPFHEVLDYINKKLGLLLSVPFQNENKAIPQQLISASFENRSVLLASFIDVSSTKWNSEQTQFEIISYNEKLSLQISSLSRSLGFNSTVHKTNDNHLVFVKNGSLHFKDLPMLLESKKQLSISQTEYSNDNLCYPIEINKLENGKYVGFQLGMFSTTSNWEYYRTNQNNLLTPEMKESFISEMIIKNEIILSNSEGTANSSSNSNNNSSNNNSNIDDGGRYAGRFLLGDYTVTHNTLAYVLPMIRHVSDQPPLQSGDGPIAIVLSPTRELAQQIASTSRRFSRLSGLTVASVYGGAGIADQIGDLKRGAEIVVCTPGRMIDVLVSNAGRITNLRRCTFVVLDEADRMFDLGFEPQITRIIDCIRPDRQTVMFSATFPYAIEMAARKYLQKPLEIICGGRSVACKDVDQIVEVMPDEESKFRRLLELVRDGCEAGNGQILIFVHKQSSADKLFQELLGANYPVLVLHGGVDQNDRQSTIADFKRGEKTIMVATSVASRGLDVKGLSLVINFDVPSHLEDYVHRIGRTGRAGRKGTAYTFIVASDKEDKYAPDIVRALKMSEQYIPEDLIQLAEKFQQRNKEAKEKLGHEIVHGGGFGGKGFKFNEEEKKKIDEQKRIQRIMHGCPEGEEENQSPSQSEDEEESESGSESENENKKKRKKKSSSNGNKNDKGEEGDGENEENEGDDDKSDPTLLAAAAAATAAVNLLNNSISSTTPITTSTPLISTTPSNLINTNANANTTPTTTNTNTSTTTIQQQQQQQQSVNFGIPEAAAKAAAWAMALNASQAQLQLQQKAAVEKTHFEEELEINDIPQSARFKVTHRDSLSQISEYTGAAITVRGIFVPYGRQPKKNERKLYLLVEGNSQECIARAKHELKRLIDESTYSGPGTHQTTGHYVV